jgi:hypothetical protein
LIILKKQLPDKLISQNKMEISAALKPVLRIGIVLRRTINGSVNFSQSYTSECALTKGK